MLNTATTYAAALQWLFGRTRNGAAKGPERTRSLLKQLGWPEKNFDAIHVIGTNGKGSVCAMLDAGLRQANNTIGRFTSPHLENYRERIVVNGEMISEARVQDFLLWAQEQADDASFFDLTTALAFLYFAERQVDMAVVEAGVGGARDHSMTLARVNLVLITNVAEDHLDVIGPSLSNVANEKAGAIREAVPCITAARGAALKIIREMAQARHAPLYVLNNQDELFSLPHAPVLLGAHQMENAQLVAAALRLNNHNEAAVERALSAKWPGRLERFSLQGTEIILDGAHNPSGARALADALREMKLQNNFTLLFGAMARKQVQEILAPLAALATQKIFTSPGDGTANIEELAKQCNGVAIEDSEAALLRALDAGQPVVVAGSLYLVGKLRTVLLKLGAQIIERQ